MWDKASRGIKIHCSGIKQTLVNLNIHGWKDGQLLFFLAIFFFFKIQTFLIENKFRISYIKKNPNLQFFPFFAHKKVENAKRRKNNCKGVRSHSSPLRGGEV